MRIKTEVKIKKPRSEKQMEHFKNLQQKRKENIEKKKLEKKNYFKNLVNSRTCIMIILTQFSKFGGMMKII